MTPTVIFHNIRCHKTTPNQYLKTRRSMDGKKYLVFAKSCVCTAAAGCNRLFRNAQKQECYATQCNNLLPQRNLKAETSKRHSWFTVISETKKSFRYRKSWMRLSKTQILISDNRKLEIKKDKKIPTQTVTVKFC